jgi:hypothetical protein
LTSNDDPWYNLLSFCYCFQQVKFTANLGQEPLESNTQAVNLDKNRNNRRPNSRAKSRELFCPAHPEQRISGNGRKYFLHLVKSEDLRLRGMSDKRARLLIQSYPVLVLSNEWLEELFCPQCGSTHWCHVVRHDRVVHTLSWAPRELWKQVAHVDRAPVRRKRRAGDRDRRIERIEQPSSGGRPGALARLEALKMDFDAAIDGMKETPPGAFRTADPSTDANTADTEGT